MPRILILLLTLILLPPSFAAAEQREDPASLPILADISEDFPYERHYVEVKGSQLAYYEVGRGQPILFVHGIPTWSYAWRNVMPHLEPAGRVIAVDLPGFGHSSIVRDLTPRDHVAFLEAFIEELNLKDVILILHDFGAIGLNYAFRNPDNVAGVAFMELPIEEPYTNGPPEGAVFAKPANERLIGFVTALRDDAQSQTMVVDQNMFASDPVLLNGVTRQWSEREKTAYKAPFDDVARREALRELLSNFLFDGSPTETARVVREQGAWLTEAETPKLAIVSRPGSLMKGEFIRREAGRITNLTIVEVGQSRHLIMEDHPHTLGLVLRGWISGL